MTDKQVESLRPEKTQNRTNGNSRTEKYIIKKKKKSSEFPQKRLLTAAKKRKFDESVEII